VTAPSTSNTQAESKTSLGMTPSSFSSAYICECIYVYKFIYIYICICIRIFIYIICIHRQSRKHPWGLHPRRLVQPIHVCIYIYIYVYIYICIYIVENILGDYTLVVQFSLYLYEYSYICMHIGIYVWMNT
jgi:hypothetical protein